MNRGLLAAIIVGAGAAGAAAYYLFGQPPQPAPVVDTAAQPPTAEPAAPTAGLATKVPHFELVDREGKRRSLADWQGRALIVNFWATWCAPCRREIPLLQQIAREHADEGFAVVGIAVDYREKVLEYANEMKIDYPLLIGEQDALDAAAAFGVEAIGFPFTIFSDVQGRIVAARMGELDAAQAAVFLREVAEVNAGRRTPEQARAAIEADLAALQQDVRGKSAG